MLSPISQAQRLYGLGCYSSWDSYYDTLQALNSVPFFETIRFKRTCLYPLFGKRLRKLGAFETHVFFHKYILKGDKSTLDKDRVVLEVREAKEHRAKKLREWKLALRI